MTDEDTNMDNKEACGTRLKCEGVRKAINLPVVIRNRGVVIRLGRAKRPSKIL
jgi:hypothetical protein